MSVSFYGKTRDGEPLTLDHDDPALLNLANGNARSFLEFLGIDPGADCLSRNNPEAGRRSSALVQP